MPFFVRLNRLLILFGLLYFILIGETTTTAAAAAAIPNPYHILGISPHDCDDDDVCIKKRYRELCLKYHPDKNRNSNHAKEYEHLFKQVQWAYEQIATKEARQAYRQKQWFEQQKQQQQPSQPQHYYRTNSYNSPEEDILRTAFANAFRQYASSSSSSSFYPNAGGLYRGRDFFGFDVHPLFRNTGLSTTFQSIYKQTITVPLSDMYQGRSSMSVHLHNHFGARLLAVLRSGMGYLIVYQAILMAIPMLRFSKWLALVWSIFCLERFLPRLYVRQQYDIEIKPGYKSGTKLVFEDESGTGSPGVQVQFILKEKVHPIYTRIGNNLHVSCVLSPRDARNGCHLQIPSLADEGTYLSVPIPKHTKSGDTIRIMGQGWPNRKSSSHGDLIVTITGVSRWKSQSKIIQRNQPLWEFWNNTPFYFAKKVTS